MQFSTKQWRRYYDMINHLGSILKSSKPDVDGNPCVHSLSKEAQRSIELEMEALIMKCHDYLDLCNIKSKPSLWKYNINDKKTWLSSPKFSFEHLLNLNN